MKKFLFLIVLTVVCKILSAQSQYVNFNSSDGGFDLSKCSINYNTDEWQGVKIAVENLCQDIFDVTGTKPEINNKNAEYQLFVGTINKSKSTDNFIKKNKIDISKVKDNWEAATITPINKNSIAVIGADKRGTIFAIYDISKNIGVSPWKFWADVPIVKHDFVVLKINNPIVFPSPKVKYRGIFLNDEVPCLSGWVREKFPDSQCPSAVDGLANGMNSNFYKHVFELLLRLKANYLWPAMWGNAFYADDSLNSKTADEMGIVMGTSHHEPMARNHQEWARNRAKNGAWDYDKNQNVIDSFFREGIKRSKNNEDIITIGMRGDGDAPMGGEEGKDDEYVSRDEYNLKLMQRIFENQRNIIAQETKMPANKRQQVWALYKEVQHLYEIGLKVPDDVIILLCDDNWGNIRKVPTANHPGGWGMYYHVDYVGAPRNTKWANVTPIAHLWEQMTLSYQYGINKIWILNVGDLKPMEYPIDLFLNMALDPDKINAQNLNQHTEKFCTDAFGQQYAKPIAEILETYCRFNGRVTPEMLNENTYNLFTGEFQHVVDQYKALQADAFRYYNLIDNNAKNAYYQLILFPVETMANLYQMYYAKAMNKYLASLNDPQANYWADVCDQCFNQDSLYTVEYHTINNGKWNHFMSQTHIGYTSWNEPPTNIRPTLTRLPENAKRKPCYAISSNGYIAIEAEHYNHATNSANASWTTINGYGRTKSGVALMPYNQPTNNAELVYKFKLPENIKTITVHIITNSTLPFLRQEGHRYLVNVDDNSPVEINYNGRYTDKNQWETFDVVATRIIETSTTFNINNNNIHSLSIKPIEPGLVVEKIVIDYGGYQKQHLFGTESEFRLE